MISVIIPTCNRPDLLKRALVSLAGQSLPQDSFEVIVVDNRPTNETADIASFFKKNICNLRYVVEPLPGLHNARHKGLKEASSDILAYIDDDSETEPDWLVAFVKVFEDPEVALAGGNNYPCFEIDPPEWLLRWWQNSDNNRRALGYLSILDYGEGVRSVDPAYVWGCNFAVRKELLVKSGGFHPDSFPRDLIRFRGDGETHVSNVIRGSGFRTVFDSRASVHHFVPKERMTKAYFMQRAYDQGISDSYADIRAGRCQGIPLRWRINWLRSLLRAYTRIALNAGDRVARELLNVQRETISAHCRGYRFHQQEVGMDPLLLDWVLKKDYLE